MSAIAKGEALAVVWLVVWAAVDAPGCAASQSRKRSAEAARDRAVEAYVQDKPFELRPRYALVIAHGRRNRVLNQMQAGLAAFDYGRFDLAKESFDEVLNGIETVFANSKQAAKARSLWRAERSKIFKGEPYERAMAYYYRGLLYMIDDDYENARACFKSGVLQDAFAEEKQNRCDFALLIFLEGWASQCLGDAQLAEEAYEEVKLLRPDFQPPAPGDNVLVLAETGRSPRKVASGRGGAELRYSRGEATPEQQVRLFAGSGQYDMHAMEDVYWQASTRGGRPVEKILKDQVVFKEGRETFGTALTTIGMGAVAAGSEKGHRNRDMQAVGGAIAAVGLLSLATANAVEAQADTRHWDNLPDFVHIRTFKTGRGAPATVHGRFLDRESRPLKHLDKCADVHFDKSDRHGVAWFRSRSAL